MFLPRLLMNFRINGVTMKIFYKPAEILSGMINTSKEVTR